MLRMPAVAGHFYPSGKVQLRALIEKLIEKKTNKLDAIACMLPHAGYIYSGMVAGKTISQVEVKDTCVIVGPNHTGAGRNISIMTEGSWQMPFGNIEIDSAVCERIKQNSSLVVEDILAHSGEHSLEVEVPFLQFFNDKVKIAPLVVSELDLKTCRELGQAIAKSVDKEKTLFVASSDMTHYEDEQTATEKDKIAIGAILNLDEKSLFDVVRLNHISMCGYIPSMIMISYAKALGAKKAKLVCYETSAKTNKDYSSVVGYAGIVIN